MYNRVVALALLVVAVENTGEIGHGKHLNHIVDRPGKLFGQIAKRDEAKEIAQNADRVRDIVECRPATELLLGSGAGGKETVGDSLCKEVGKLCSRYRPNKVGLKRLIKPA